MTTEPIENWQAWFAVYFHTFRDYLQTRGVKIFRAHPPVLLERSPMLTKTELSLEALAKTNKDLDVNLFEQFASVAKLLPSAANSSSFRLTRPLEERAEVGTGSRLVGR